MSKRFISGFFLVFLSVFPRNLQHFQPICMIDIKVPTVGESISEVTLLKWTKPNGAWVERDEVIAELESEKATFEINAEQAGILNTVLRKAIH